MRNRSLKNIRDGVAQHCFTLVRTGDPPALPGRHPKFDGSGSAPWRCCGMYSRRMMHASALHTYRLGLVILTLGRDQPPFEGGRDP